MSQSFSSRSTQHSASIRAVSLAGVMGIHRSRGCNSKSSARGLIKTNSAPLSRATSMAPRTMCLLTPPALIWKFLAGIPPKHTNNSVCSLITCQVVGSYSGSRPPTTWGSNVSDAPWLYVCRDRVYPPRQLRNRCSWLCAWWKRPALAQPYEPPKIAVLPNVERTRSNSRAARSSAWSQVTSTNSSSPRAPAPGPSSSHPRRTYGCRMRARVSSDAGMLPSRAEGSGSSASGMTRSPSDSTDAVNKPQ